MDDGERVIVYQLRLLKVFLVLDNKQCKEYQRALSMSIVLWFRMRAHNHPAWQIFKNNASAFNEESGEICFSVLARGIAIASSGIRSDCKAVSRKFCLIKSSVAVRGQRTYRT